MGGDLLKDSQLAKRDILSPWPLWLLLRPWLYFPIWFVGTPNHQEQ